MAQPSMKNHKGPRPRAKASANQTKKRAQRLAPHRDKTAGQSPDLNATPEKRNPLEPVHFQSLFLFQFQTLQTINKPLQIGPKGANRLLSACKVSSLGPAAPEAEEPLALGLPKQPWPS